jgi:hypothetical protein
MTDRARVKVGSVLVRRADGRRFVVKAIRRRRADDPLDNEEVLTHQRRADTKPQRPRLNSGLSYAGPRVDEPPFPEGS